VTLNSFGCAWNGSAAPAADHNLHLYLSCGHAVTAINCAHVAVNHNGKK